MGSSSSDSESDSVNVGSESSGENSNSASESNLRPPLHSIMGSSSSESESDSDSASKSKEEGGEKEKETPLTREGLEQKTVPFLKGMLKECNLRIGGKKNELIDRLLGLEVEDHTDLSRMPVSKLREMLKARHLPSGGKKEELINRLEGTENVDTGTFAYFDRYTSKELIEILQAQNRDTGGTKDDRINRLLGKEPSMPPEGWANSKDREMLIEALQKTEPSSLRFKTAEEVYSIQPFDRWPWYRFKSYFKDALISVLKEETIARQDNRDFESLLKINPRPKLNSRGEPYWSSHVAKDLLEQDLLDAMESDPPSFLKPKDLWESRPEYGEFKLKTFQGHITQQMRRFRQFPGWQKQRNERANELYRQEVDEERNAQRWAQSYDNDNELDDEEEELDEEEE